MLLKKRLDVILKFKTRKHSLKPRKCFKRRKNDSHYYKRFLTSILDYTISPFEEILQLLVRYIVQTENQEEILSFCSK